MRTKADVRQRLWFYGFHALGPVDTYRIHRMMAARVTTA
jgi:hypothetical protein